MIYHVFANRSNIGDWLSAKGIQKLVGPADVVECLCDTPFLDETFRTLSKATAKDLIIIGGGGLFMDYFVPFWKRFEPVSRRVPFCIWGVGCCDLKQENSLPPRSLVGDIVERSRLCVVRDQLTADLVGSDKVSAPVPCPSLSTVQPVPEGPDVLHVVNYSTVGPKNYKLMRKVSEAFARERGSVFRETNNLINKGREDELARLLDLYKRSGIIVSSALHGCVLGVGMGRRVIAVSGDRKIDAFMEAVGLGKWCLSNEDVNALGGLVEQSDAQVAPSDAIQNIREQNLQVATRIKQILAGL